MKNLFKKMGLNLTTSFLVAGMLVSCANSGDDNQFIYPALSLLTNNRLTVLLKATYASDEPLSFKDINDNQLFLNADGELDLTDVPKYDKLPIYLDVGEIRLSTRNLLDDLHTINTADASEDLWDVITTTRQVYCSDPYSLDLKYDSCYETGGLVNFQELMNGNGAVYPSRDIGKGTYLHVGLYVRAIVTGFARKNDEPSYTEFDNVEVKGHNILPHVNYNPGTDSATQQLLAPQFFPLHHRVEIGQHTTTMVPDIFSPQVLEIRFNMKENLMVHSYDTGTGLRTVVSFSDWRINHSEQFDMGGNVFLRGRIFNPTLVNDLKITGGTSSTRHYYALYIENECVDFFEQPYCEVNNSHLPIAATPVRDGTNTLKNIGANNYMLQCLYDEAHDGFPEKVLGQITFTLGTGPNIEEVHCACGHSTQTGCD